MLKVYNIYREGKLSQVEIICIIVIVIVIVGEISNIEYRIYISVHLFIYLIKDRRSSQREKKPALVEKMTQQQPLMTHGVPGPEVSAKDKVCRSLFFPLSLFVILDT